MCGISAVIGGDCPGGNALGMAMATETRGTQIYIDEFDNAAVGYNWLKITDQTVNEQPFTCGDFKAWLNGYISNYKELAIKYDIELTTTCDAELLVKFLEKFKGERLDELNGFFAVAYYNGTELKFFTDRYGIKQLYRYERDGVVYVCSEVKGILRMFPNLGLDQNAVIDWKHSLGVMTDNTIYNGITRIKKLPFIRPNKIKIDYLPARIRLGGLLQMAFMRNATEQKTGVFLSGGIDSGILAKYMNPDYCFSVDYADDKYSEIENIKLNSTSEHYTLICNHATFNKYLKPAIDVLDDPKVGSCYTNYALTKLASKFCTVLYSGAGGDELFGGYPHRNNRPIEQVIKRTENPPLSMDYSRVTHDEYNWRFLQGVLIVEDRMGGAFTMETRYPFLDNDFVDFVLSLPDEYLHNKRILKDISGLHPDVINGKKRGFSNPHLTNDEWVKNVMNGK